MSEKLPRVTANEMIKIVEKLGFCFSRQSGSHKIYKNDEGKRVTIPYHSGKILHPKIVSILVDAGISVDEFKKMMKSKNNEFLNHCVDSVPLLSIHTKLQ